MKECKKPKIKIQKSMSLQVTRQRGLAFTEGFVEQLENIIIKKRVFQKKLREENGKPTKC